MLYSVHKALIYAGFRRGHGRQPYSQFIEEANFRIWTLKKKKKIYYKQKNQSVIYPCSCPWSSLVVSILMLRFHLFCHNFFLSEKYFLLENIFNLKLHGKLLVLVFDCIPKNALKIFFCIWLTHKITKFSY